VSRAPFDVALLPGEVVVCRLDAAAPLPAGALEAGGPLACAVRTARELSLVCPPTAAPAEARVEGPWRVLAVAGPLDLALTGALHALTGPLADAGIPVFPVGTYDTDHLLVPAADADRALAALAAAGHRVHGA
jgi:hypothetical protein